MKSIGQASKLSGVGIETIRYYEREGIVPKPNRSPNGRRIYDSEGIARLRFVRRCRDLGFPMISVRRLQVLAFSKNNNCGEAAELGRHNLETVREKIEELLKLERALIDLVAECDAHPKQCPMLDRLMFS